MIRVLIVDDEAPAHKVLETYCGRVSDLRIVGNCYDATSALNLLREQDVDLMFLDIQMSDLTGLELLQTLEKPPQVVLVTAYAEYALESYDFGVSDYLLKPVRYARFLQAVEKVRKRLQHNTIETSIPLPETRHEKAAETDAFTTVEEEGVLRRIPLPEILWAESAANYVKLHTAGSVHTKRITLSELETLFRPHGFLRVHKSFLVRADAIRALDGNRIRIGDELIPVGATYRQAVRDALKGIC
ncbi:MAG: response regulator transcription factor [Balneolales bacterium]|nr:response regulator transcription factor [Balneolales bacterium]